MLLFSMGTCEEHATKNHMLGAKFIDFLGRCRYASSFSLFIRFIEYFRFVFGKPLKPLFFSILLPYHLLFFRGQKKSSVWGRGVPSPLPSRNKPSFVMPILSLSLFNLKISPLHLNHDIVLLHFHNLNPFQHLPKCPKMRRTRSCSRKDISVATSSIDVATQEPSSRNPIKRKCI
jgi:hypothetical protein